MAAKRRREEDTADEEEAARREEELIEKGPMSILRTAVKTGQKILINCRHNRKLLANIKAFDRHMNMVLEGVQEMWTEIPRAKKGQKVRPVNKYRHIPKMFLRGDCVILVVKNPTAGPAE
eukprot:TRINITY_DN13589_c0_g2_i1.p1 TRINITY_DN13589_c0_g2~~TRINITY_DN13589_c0_g2_i1.p1  ORF type:complete len:141 (+),score=43.25 TRINITY_DN13589_c0_g2_i1:64-423(+)